MIDIWRLIDMQADRRVCGWVSQACHCSAWQLSLLSYGYVTVKVFWFGRRHTAVCDLSQ